MMATAAPPSSSGLLPLLESLEDVAAGQSEQTDVYLTIASRLSGEEGRQFLPAVEKHFPRLAKAILAHIASPNAELSQAALQALGFCVYHSHVVSGAPEVLAAEILSALCSLVVKSTDKNTCTRSLWVISKQNFPADVVSKKVSLILTTLESIWSREDVQSVVMEHEALNVVIRMLEQVPVQMGDGAVQWAKLVVPLVVHSASKVRLRAAAALELGLPLLLEKQVEVAAVIEPMMSSKLIPELQKLFMSKNETNVLKLWPLFVKLLGKLLHRGGPFINSLLHLEELGFRSSSPTIKKIAFIAWKSLIDNFALNPDILCSSKRMKLLMQPLMSITVRTEALLLTKVEVWWYLVVQLGHNLSTNFDQVSVPLLQTTIGSDLSSVPGTPSRPVPQNGAATPVGNKTGRLTHLQYKQQDKGRVSCVLSPSPGFSSSANLSLMSLNSSVQLSSCFPSIQLLGLEMLLHYFLGPDVVAAAAKNKLLLSLEPLNHPLLSGVSSFTKHSAVLISSVTDGFSSVGKDAPESLLAVIWTSLVRFVNLTIESGGSKKDRQGCEVLTLMLQALQNIVSSEALPADRVLVLFEVTVKGIPQRVLGSASYQVGKMDVLNGTPALFLIQLLYNSSMSAAFVEDERFFQCLQTLVGCGLSGPTSPLTFSEAVLGAIGHSAVSLQNKEQLLRMWSIVVGPLTDTITQSNEVNQGDALEHNFSSVHSALMLPVTHLLQGVPLQQASQKSMLSLWSKLYKVFARCSALVVTAEENICCEELCGRMVAAADRGALTVPSTLNSISSFLQVMVECVDFSPFTPQFQQKLKSPHTPVNWMKKRSRALGNLSTFQSLLVQCLEVYLENLEGSSEATGSSLVSVLSTLFTSLVLNNAVQEALSSLVHPLKMFYSRAASEPPTFSSQLLLKLEKLLGDIVCCLQSRSTLAFNDELLVLLAPLLCVLFPHKNKQLRTSVTHFWNSTFANAVSLSYPEDLRSILSHVKQKTPIILPGFEVLNVPDELSGQYSSEGSQMETKLSGIPVCSVKDRSSRTSKPVPTKLDFSSPKPPRREVLEEEASIDFVFIPPETKERVLTEHQKEVKRMKRVDIPAMYNNLDASLDTTVFSQFTQSQDDSQDKVTNEQTNTETREDPQKAPQEDVENEINAEVLTKDTEDYVSPKDPENTTEKQQQEEVLPDSADVSMEDDDKAEGTSPNVSASSDLVSGTPQKPNSRRQSFITLEKYAEGKPASPSSVSSFTGPLVKTSSQTPSSKDSQTSTGPDSQESQTRTGNSQSSINDVPESPQRPKESRTRTEPVKLTERLPSDSTEDEDVIPDTQTEVESTNMTSTSEEEVKSSSPEGESQAAMDDSQSSPDKPKRTRSSRVQPSLPGDNPEEQDAKDISNKKRRSRETCLIESPQPLQSRPNTRSKQAAEESSGKTRLRKRPQQDGRESSQSNSQSQESKRKKIRLFSSSEDVLAPPQRTRRSTSEHSFSQTDVQSQSDLESQSQGRRGRRSKAALAELTPKDDRKLPEDPQTVELVGQTEKDGDETKKDSQLMSSPQAEGQSQESEMSEKTEKDSVEMRKDSQMSSPQGEIQSQDSGPAEQTEKDELKMDTQMSSPQGEVQSQDSGPAEQTEKDDELTMEMQMSLPQGDVQSQDSGPAEQTEKDDELKMDTQISSPQGEVQSQDSGPAEQTEKDDELTMETQMSLPQGEVQSQDFEPEGQTTDNEEPKKDSEMSLPQDEGQSQESEPEEKTSKEGEVSQIVIYSPTNDESQEVISKEENKTTEAIDDNLSQEDSQVITPSSSDGRSIRRSRRTKASPEAAEAEDRSGSRDSLKKQSGSNSQTEDPARGRRRRSKPLQLSSDSTLEGSQSLDLSQSESSQSRGRYSTRRSSPAVVGGVDSSESESSDAREASVVPKRRGRKPRASLPSPLTVESKDRTEQVDSSQTRESQSTEAKTDSVEPSEAQDLLQVEGNIEEESKEESQMEVEDETTKKTDSDDTPVKESDTKNVKTLESAGISNEQTQEMLSAETLKPSEEKPKEVSETGDADLDHQDHPAAAQDSQNEAERPHVTDEVSDQQTKPTAEDEPAPLIKEDGETQMEPQHEEKTETEEAADMDAALADDVFTESTSKDVFQDSPVKQKDLEALMEPGLGQSPSSGRTRGTWSPSASPSTSILKKGQKRPLKDETPSPLVKQQETADDIDRRSPAVRTSSPRRSKGSNIPQPKLVTTPTKGLLILSPRNLHSPGHKSSKKSLISELGQEPRPVSRDCIYPALVGCSTPVEAVLPQISSNMWSRGFGQLVRARNIKTVGDLSALTHGEIKTLPIRSPKVSNVRKALKVYEQQRKGRGGDDLKSFDETEMMTSELEETGAAPNDDDKTSAETLATELLDESPSAADQDISGNQTPEVLDGDQRPEDLLLSSDVELMSCRMSPSELGRCSVQQLVQIHDQLGGMMRRVVVELQTRVQQTDHHL
ncbi:telomere-associated protein RIF1 isoform X2 [Acanthochromis polyacanthus]|uniref:telomere-associated protein RIF1 isoform X2 n=1 Tax=Acanthochromis polyacanthus TaxID=80966 RepID=UPI00223402D6|nr:telomere-associated protein RIF1 isoform X2 [Acanthochromis polyacanthus]